MWRNNVRLARLGPPGAEIPALIEEGRALDLRPLTDDIDGPFLAAGGLALIAESYGDLTELRDADRLRVGPPVARPSAVYCTGMNYAAHAAESGSKPPDHLVMFMKPPNTVVGPYDEVEIPLRSTKTDWEVELGVVIGRRAAYLPTASDASSFIAGYTIANDLSERSWQLESSGGQWSKGKGARGFLPLGPWLVTPDEFDVSDARMKSFVNGQPRQDSSTRDLIFGVHEIVRELSQHVVLEPGDLILTGTPEGVALSGRFPYLRVGDVVDLEIVGLGSQRQRFVGAIART